MKNTTKSYLVISLLVIFGIVKYVYINNVFINSTKELFIYGFWVILGIISIIMLGFPKDKTYLKSIAIKMILVTLMLDLVVSYILGLFLGFGKNIIFGSFIGMTKLIIPVVIGVIFKEITRYIIAKNSVYNKTPIIILTIVYIIYSVTLYPPNITNFESIFLFVCVDLLPAIARECLCSYLVYNFGLNSSLIYILPLELYGYVMPILPLLGDFISSVINILVPFIVYISTVKVVKYSNKEKTISNGKIKMLLLLPIVVFLSIIVILVAGVFKYKMIAIGSNSMNPVFYRGDAVIYEKIKDARLLKKDDVIVFVKNDIMVTHRIISIIETSEGIVIKTKGDNNNIVDNFYVNEKEILGKIEYVVKYIGYPTVWLEENLRGA